MKFAVEFSQINKSFRDVYANQEVSFKVQAGSIHAIVGENGAGKTTAMKILYGMQPSDSGSISIDETLWGTCAKPWTCVADAIANGIGMVHQHFMLSAVHSVLDNILLGVEPVVTGRGWNSLPMWLRPIRREFAYQRLTQIAEQYHFHLDWKSKVGHLSVGAQQRIEILKLLYRDAKILILDEPTAVLTPQESLELFNNLKKLCREGKTILIITHKLKEVMHLADRVTVFRGGRVVGEREIGETSVDDLACLMVGHKMKSQRKRVNQSVFNQNVLEISHVSTYFGRKLHDIHLTIKAGEIVGVCGVDGNGQSELVQMILHPSALHLQRHRGFHLSRMVSQWTGQVSILGQSIDSLNTEQIRALGVGVIPEDRLRDALLMNRPVRESFLLGLQRKKPFSQWGLISDHYLERVMERVIEEYDVRPAMKHLPVGLFSGGNQQKIVIAREFRYSPQLIIAAQPTRGVDVGAIEFIHQRILKARDEGSGILLISSELDEILSLSDRILIMYEGRIVAEFLRGQVTERELGLKMGGAA